MTWRLSRAKEIEVHVVLLEEVILLLQRQDERLLLRFQMKEDSKITQCPLYSPIIRLATMLTRAVANGRFSALTVCVVSFTDLIYLMTNTSIVLFVNRAVLDRDHHRDLS